MLTYLIVCPLVFLAGFVDSIAGGGGLISLPAYIFAGLPAHNAVATNKLSSSMGTAVASWHYFRKGYMKAKFCIPALFTAFVGAWSGAKLSLVVSETILKIIMIIILPVIAFYVLRKKNLESTDDKTISVRKQIILCAAVSLIVGAYDGFYGPGTGTFLMLLLTGFAHLTLNESAGTTKAVNLTTNITSLAVFLLNGKVLIPLGLAAGACNMLGNFIGSRRFSKKGSDIVRPVIFGVVALFFIKIIVELFI